MGLQRLPGHQKDETRLGASWASCMLNIPPIAHTRIVFTTRGTVKEGESVTQVNSRYGIGPTHTMMVPK